MTAAPKIITFDQWAGYHCQLFGLTGEGQLAMVLSWESAFHLAGFTVADLAEASGHLAAFAAPKGQWEHLPAIQRRVNEQRLAAAESQRARLQDDDFGSCVWCGNSAFVVVPHLRFLSSGTPREWMPPFATQAVLCHCALARKVGLCLAQRAAADPKQAKNISLTLEQYEPLNPDWRKQLDAREAARREFNRAQRAAEGTRADLDFERLAKSLAAKFGRKRV
jgi:hypothetical protein